MIVWREKFLATAIHFGVTLLLAAVAAALIFLVWFPHPLASMIGGTELFMLVVGCDLALGPLISLVIYNSKKSRRELVTDYSIIGAVQIAALVYGVFVLAGTRPVYVAFSLDRIEITTARDISDAELAAATDSQYRTLPLSGPRFVSVVVPEKDRTDALFQALNGNEEYMRPRFYVPYEAEIEAIRKRAKTLAELSAQKPAAKPILDEAIEELKLPAEKLRWLPVHHRNGFWTALIDEQTGRPLSYLNIDPYP